MQYLGIDAGLHGALSILDAEGNLLRVIDTPTFANHLNRRDYNVAEMLDLIDEAKPCRAVLEVQQAFPKQGGVSNFTTGHGYGLWHGLLVGRGVTLDLVRPKDWKKALGLPVGATKDESVALAARLFPSGDFTGPKGGLKDGRAESALIAEYRRRIG